MMLRIVETDLKRIAFHLVGHNVERLKQSILVLGTFESPQYCKRYAHYLIPDHWGLKIGHAVTHCRDRFEAYRFPISFLVHLLLVPDQLK